MYDDDSLGTLLNPRTTTVPSSHSIAFTVCKTTPGSTLNHWIIAGDPPPFRGRGTSPILAPFIGSYSTGNLSSNIILAGQTVSGKSNTTTYFSVSAKSWIIMGVGTSTPIVVVGVQFSEKVLMRT